MGNFEDYFVFRKFLVRLDKKISDFENEFEDLNDDIEEMNDAVQMLQKILYYPSNIDSSILSSNLMDICGKLGCSFDYNEFSHCYDLYCMDSNNKEYFQNFSLFIKNIIESIDEYIRIKKGQINKNIQISKVYKISYEALIGILPDSEKRIPIDDEEILEFVFTVIKSNCGFGDENVLLMQFNELNLASLKARDKRLEAERVELEKKKIAQTLPKKLKKPQIKSELDPVVEADENVLSEEDRQSIEVGIKILEENRNLLENAYSRDMEIGVGMASEAADNFDYELDSSNRINLDIVIAHIEKILSDQPINFVKLKNAINNYHRISSSLKKIENEILAFEQENEESFNEVKVVIDEYKRMVKSISESDLMAIASIDPFKRELDLEFADNNDDDDEMYLRRLEEFVNNTGFTLGVNFYLKYKAALFVNKSYEDYLNAESLNDKKECFAFLELALEEYINLKLLEEKQKIGDSVDFNSYGAGNKLMFLMLEDGTNPIAEYISKQNFNENDFIELDRALNDLRVKDFQQLFAMDAKIRTKCKYEKKSRRHRYNDIRVVYIRLNNIVDFEIPDNKVYYLVYTAGIKHSEKDLFNFATSQHVQDAITEFGMNLNNAMKEIDSMNISEEEKKARKMAYLEEFVAKNNQDFTLSIKSLGGSLSDGSGGRK